MNFLEHLIVMSIKYLLFKICTLWVKVLMVTCLLLIKEGQYGKGNSNRLWSKKYR